MTPLAIKAWLFALLLLACPALAAAADAVTPDGGRYTGTLLDGMLHGRGRIEWPNGTRYQGEFRQGMYWGEGDLRIADDKRRYQGEFVRGEFVKGRYEDGNGNVYEGELKNWRFHGRGVLRHADGTQESGVWQYGALPGKCDERRKYLAETESALYAQQGLLDRALGALEPGRPGRTDLYLLAVAGDGSQEVFRREVDFVQKAFAGRFGTAGRTVALINSRNTLASAPMATVTSIGAALKAIGAKMNREEDILFLFLTSHGSRDHELTLDQVGMSLRGLRAQALGAMLKDSGIKWKVAVVSACYSGGFIDPLKDDTTMVITAARRDRASFGCADENDFTYFGRAFFKEALPGAGSFGQAFAKASALVDQWERNDKADAHSLPQIHAPAPVEGHLARWWAELPSAAR
jgi:hypothetical protein